MKKLSKELEIMIDLTETIQCTAFDCSNIALAILDNGSIVYNGIVYNETNKDEILKDLSLKYVIAATGNTAKMKVATFGHPAIIGDDESIAVMTYDDYFTSPNLLNFIAICRKWIYTRKDEIKLIAYSTHDETIEIKHFETIEQAKELLDALND